MNEIFFLIVTMVTHFYVIEDTEEKLELSNTLIIELTNYFNHDPLRRVKRTCTQAAWMKYLIVDNG